jgi:hypothetical protein
MSEKMQWHDGLLDKGLDPDEEGEHDGKCGERSDNEWMRPCEVLIS